MSERNHRKPPPMAYDDWLTARGLSLDTIPSPVVPQMTNEYRNYFLTHRNERRSHPLHQHLEKGTVPAYGVSTDNSGNQYYMRGPLNLFSMFPTQQDFGPEYGIGFSRDYRGVMTRNGYQLENIIARDENNPLDHQVWRVRQIGSQTRLACKIASARFQATRFQGEAHPSQVVAKVTHEARILLRCNHQNIVKLLDVIEIEERTTGFPYNFVATVMELMSGTAETVMQTYPNCQLPRHLAQRCLKDCVLAVDYLQNQMDEIRVAHLAIMPRNILYTIPSEFGIELVDLMIFKLGDFEECIIFNREQEDPEKPIDIWRDSYTPPYSHEFSGPEFIQAIYDPDQLETLRLFPNDIYSVAYTVAYLMIGGQGQLNQMRLHQAQRSMRQMAQNSLEPLSQVIHLMSVSNPQQRISAQQLVGLPAFNALADNSSLFDLSFTSFQL